MTTESNNYETNAMGISRRKVLAGLGMVGVASAGAGFGTTAYFSDEETFEGNTLTAGQLELSVTWQQLYYGGPQSSRSQDYGTAMRPFVNAYPDHDGDGLQSFERDDGVHEYVDLDGYEDHEQAAKEGRNLEFACEEIATFDEPSFAPNEESLIELDDVKPGDCGEITFGTKLCDNPGYIWLHGVLTDESDGGHAESGGAELADKIVARAWYDDGDNVFQEDEPQIAAGSLREVLEELNEGLLLQYDPVVIGESEEEIEPGDLEGDCIALPKEDDVIANLAEGDEFTYDVDGETIVITIEEVFYKDDEPTGFSWSSNVPICQVTLKGGPDGIAPGEGLPTVYPCAYEGTVNTEINPNNNQPYGISNFRFFYCDVDNGNGDIPVEENGGLCFQPSNTRFIGFEWCLPTNVGNEVQGDSVSFDLSFYTEQCRHNPDPVNPFAEENGNDDENGDNGNERDGDIDGDQS
ncbi:SipW-dependent-type signal peptide-containing protein [Halalkaliarchaeum sp. AArc-GB]|uniref:SipW-dependent-type signal peptide-containing protein n=1 Tax=Halalkaliarchaeum sp. AArc-GB TaxID=3074078 RepID=UPI0028644324|nr:SipW-dependent-type signal peptide-containing protein [Halalkaliarchaeum sp. AArc-GB]MDR5671572.1 SipW-dependent-type signal peptide-containing protein [Halalkaliarchaeum sp. AArc-GB]